MDYFYYKNNELYAEDVPLSKIVDQYGTPCYIYSRQTLERAWSAFDSALENHDHLICYAVKANSNLAVLNVLARLGSGFDIVSQGELKRVIAAGGDPKKVVYSGVVKTREEIEFALDKGIHCFNVESESELNTIQEVAFSRNELAPISLRINPDINVQTHPYIATGLRENKFGIEYSRALDLYRDAVGMSHLNVIGIDCHIGSQITSLEPFNEALEKLMVLVNRLEKEDIHLQHIDLGGGLGVRYHAKEKPPAASELVTNILQKLKSRSFKIILEPGRSIVANAGLLVTKAHYIKRTSNKNFLLVDAAMNDLCRPSLYDAYHDIIPVQQNTKAVSEYYDVVGPVCESGDFLGKDRLLSVRENDLLAICSAGAYSFSMSSQYNSRPRAAEILVDRDRVFEIRKREKHKELFAHERLPI